MSIAWLSSVRGLNRRIHFYNGRNLYIFIKKRYYLLKRFIVLELKSSPHGLSILGYTRVTKVKTKIYKKEIWRDKKFTLVRDYF